MLTVATGVFSLCPECRYNPAVTVALKMALKFHDSPFLFYSFSSIHPFFSFCLLSFYSCSLSLLTLLLCYLPCQPAVSFSLLSRCSQTTDFTTACTCTAVCTSTKYFRTSQKGLTLRVAECVVKRNQVNTVKA